MAIKLTGVYKGKSNKPGGGGRFKQTVDAIMKKNPKMPEQEARGIAAKEGIAKFGAKQMQKWSAAGIKRAKKK